MKSRNLFGAVLGAIGLVAILGLSTGGFPSQPLFQLTSLGAINPSNRDTALGENTRHMLQITELNTLADQPSLSFNAYGPQSGGLFANDVHFNRYNGTLASPTALLSGDTFMSIGSRGWDGTANLSSSATAFATRTAEAWDTTHHGSLFAFDIVPSGGATNRQNILQLDGTVAGGNFVDVVTNGTGDSSLGYIRFNDAVRTRFGYAGKASAGFINYESDAGVSLQANGGGDKLNITTAHALTFNNVSLAPNSGTFTATGTGGTGGTTSSTATWNTFGLNACVSFQAINFTTSNATTFTVTGLPAAIQPATLAQTMALPNVQDAGSFTGQFAAQVAAASGTMTLLKNGTTTGWTASGVKGWPASITMCWLLN